MPSKKKFEIGNFEILLINKKKIFAIKNICPHMNLPLDMGQITESDSILCPYHNSEFCFKSGVVKKWIGSEPELTKEICEPLEIIPTLKMESYIWVQSFSN